MSESTEVEVAELRDQLGSIADAVQTENEDLEPDAVRARVIALVEGQKKQ